MEVLYGEIERTAHRASETYGLREPFHPQFDQSKFSNPVSTALQLVQPIYSISRRSFFQSR